MDTKALRQKILDLAIRGKLVPQDPNDEPASVLLQRIRAEKQQMVKDGKLKAKDIKNDTVIFLGDDNLHYEKFPDGTVKCIEDEIPFELPEGWEWTRLESVFKLSSGKAIKVRQLEDDGEYPVYGGNGINGLYSMYNVESETIIIGRVGFYCGSVYKTTSQAWVTDNALIASITEPSFYQIDFLCNLLKYLDLGKTSVSTAQPVVSGKGIYPLLVPIPPLDEQKRIVTKLNDCVSIVDVLESDNSDLQTTIQLTKSKILDLAIRGKLIPQNPDDEPASVLLDRVRAEKEELIKQGKIKRDKKESVIYKGDDNSYYEVIGKDTENIDDDIPYDIPDGWAWCRIKDICQMNAGKSKAKDQIFPEPFNNCFPCYGGNGHRGYVDTYNYEGKYCIVGRQGALCGNVNTAEGKFYATEHAVVVTLFDKVHFEWSFFTLKTLNLNQYATGAAQPGLSVANIQNVFIPIPPLNEQKRIADKVSQLFSLLDSIAENVN